MRISKTITVLLFPLVLSAQNNTKKYINKYNEEVHYTEEEMNLRLPEGFKPVFDFPMRDIAVIRTPDSTFYMTGTTGYPDWWAVTSEIKVWKSKDLKKWTPVIDGKRERALVWNVDQDGSAWLKKIVKREGIPFRPIWAPEIHYIKNNFWLTLCVPQLGNTILKSSTAKASGPYVPAFEKDVPLSNQIDGSLFEDDNGKVYSVSGNGRIIPLKDDLSGPDGPEFHVKPANMSSVGFEGAFLFKREGKYYMAAADFVNGDYHCFVASADHIYGPYGDRYLAIPHGGHSTFFQDNEGKWWATFFGNDSHSPFKERPGLLRMTFDEHGHIRPL